MIPFPASRVRWYCHRVDSCIERWISIGMAASRCNWRFLYRARTHLLSAGEMAFYRVLLEAVGERHTIAMKVRLAEVITCLADSWYAGYLSSVLFALTVVAGKERTLTISSCDAFPRPSSPHQS